MEDAHGSPWWGGSFFECSVYTTIIDFKRNWLKIVQICGSWFSQAGVWPLILFEKISNQHGHSRANCCQCYVLMGIW
jgi:hypothetical protein